MGTREHGDEMEILRSRTGLDSGPAENSGIVTLLASCWLNLKRRCNLRIQRQLHGAGFICQSPATGSNGVTCYVIWDGDICESHAQSPGRRLRCSAHMELWALTNSGWPRAGPLCVRPPKTTLVVGRLVRDSARVWI